MVVIVVASLVTVVMCWSFSLQLATLRETIAWRLEGMGRLGTRLHSARIPLGTTATYNACHTTCKTVDEMTETGTGDGGSDGCSDGGTCRGNDKSSDVDSDEDNERNGRDNDGHSGGGSDK